MEIKKYLGIFQRWFWFLILGMVLGASIAFIFSIRQVKVYRSSTRVQVMSAPASENYYSYFTDQQLAKTYIQTIKSSPVINGVKERLGVPVNSGQITAKSVTETQLIDISVVDTDPQRAADIANTLVLVFAEINNQQQSERYIESENSLLSQISAVDAQIKELQSQSSAEVEEYLASAQEEIATLEGEILTLQGNLETLTNRSRESGFWSTPTPTPDQSLQINEIELRLSQLQKTYDLYQEIYTNLVVMGSSGTSGNSYSSGQMQSTLALYEQIRTNLLSSYEEVRLARLNSTSNIVQIEPATVSNSPIRPLTTTNVLIGAFIGLLLVSGIAFLKEFFDDSIKTSEMIKKELGLPVIGYIANMEHESDLPYTMVNPRSPISESFRSLRTNIEFSSVDKPLRTILVVSANPMEGKSTISANLAFTIAQGEKNVLLVDADLRRPHIHKLFDLPNRMGLSDLFINSASVKEVLHPWKYTNLTIITSGGIPPNPSDLLSSNKMNSLLDEFKKYFDIIIVDAPPFLVADAAILASHMDGVLMVIYQGKTPLDSSLSTLEQMKRVGANIIGVVMNRIPRNKSTYYARNSYYSSYYHDDYYLEGKRKGLFSRSRSHTHKHTSGDKSPIPDAANPKTK